MPAASVIRYPFVPPASPVPDAQYLLYLLQLQELTTRLKEKHARPNRRVRALRAAIPADVLTRFDHVMALGKPIVVSITSTGACGACHLNLPRGVVSAVRSVPYGLKCPYCACYLYALEPDFARTAHPPPRTHRRPRLSPPGPP